MRLLCTITAYPPSTGGAQLHLHGLLTHLTRTRAEVVSFWDQNRSDWLMGTTLRAPIHAVDYTVDGVPVHRLGTSWVDRARGAPGVVAYYGATRWAAAHLARPLVRRLQPRVDAADVVHCVRVGREPLALASAEAARRADRPFVLTPLHHPRWGGRRHRVYLDLYRRADCLIALTPAERETLIGFGAHPDAVRVTGTGPVLAADPDPEGFRARHALTGPMVLFLGQHFRYKGFTAVLDPKLLGRDVTAFIAVAIGPMAIGDSEQEVFLGRELVQRREVSEETARLVDDEVKTFLDEAYRRATATLRDHRDLLQRIAEALLERETLDREEIALLETGKPLPPSTNGSAPAGDESKAAPAPAAAS